MGHKSVKSLYLPLVAVKRREDKRVRKRRSGLLKVCGGRVGKGARRFGRVLCKGQDKKKKIGSTGRGGQPGRREELGKTKLEGEAPKHRLSTGAATNRKKGWGGDSSVHDTRGLGS